jgi:serine/threonine-protein kinase
MNLREAKQARQPQVSAGATCPESSAGDGSAGDAGAAAPAAHVPGYELLGELGRGGMGVVYKARQVDLGRTVALKMILGGPWSGAAERSRFRAEAEAIARLQHPNVVQIHDWGERDGQPYFSLEFVDGCSLAQRIGGRPMAPREAARLLEAVARGVHVAHGQGIVHRDLKPSNILLTASGVPKVADFGLAKRLGEGGGAGLTASGQLMGTPSYMAPEQAQGRTRLIGPATDVYALGAVLYEMLTGRPPFLGRDALHTLLQVIGKEPVPIGQLQPDVPRDLQSVCLKCLRKEPGKRYGSAEALAEDLGRFLDDRPVLARPATRRERAWRWARRNPGVASLAAVLAVVFVASFAVITALWVRADRRLRQVRIEHALAERRYREHRKAIDEFFSAVAARDLFDVPGAQPLRRELLNRALVYYKGFVAEHAGDGELAAELAAAHFRVALIAGEIGPAAEAIAEYGRAVALWRGLPAEVAADPVLAADVAAAMNNVGLLQRKVGDAGAALASFRESAEVSARLAEGQPGRAEYRAALADALANAGGVLALDGAGEAGASYGRAIELLAELTREAPANEAYRHRLAEVWADMGVLRAGAGDLAEAERCYRRARELRQSLASERGVRFGRALAALDADEGSLQRRLGRPAEALRLYVRSREGWERLAGESPTVAELRAGLAMAWIDVGVACGECGRPRDALAAYERAITVARPLVADEPGDAAFAAVLAQALHGAGVARLAVGETEEAVGCFREARALREALAGPGPGSVRRRRDLADSIAMLGVALAQSGVTSQALGPCGEAARMLEALRVATPEDADVRGDLAAVYNNLGVFCCDVGRPSAALEPLGRAMELREATARRGEWAASCNSLGEARLALGRVEEAVEAFRRAAEVQERLAKARPGDAASGSELAQTWANLGACEMEAGRPDGAMEWYRRAREGMGGAFNARADAEGVEREAAAHLAAGRCDEARRLAERALVAVEGVVGEMPGGRMARARAQCLLGEIDLRCERWEAAGERFGRGIELLEDLVSRDPDNLTWQGQLGVALHGAAAAAAGGGRDQRALALYVRAMAAQARARAGDAGVVRYRRDLEAHYRALAGLLRRGSQEDDE